MIGNATTPIQANQQIGNIAVSLRTAFGSLESFVEWFNATNNTIALIQTTFGLTAGDAATLQAVVGNLQALLNIYQGISVSQTLPFNFEVNSSVLWGGV